MFFSVKRRLLAQTVCAHARKRFFWDVGCSPILYVRTWYHTVVCRPIPGTNVENNTFPTLKPRLVLSPLKPIDETAGTPSVLLAAVTLSMRQQVHPVFCWPQLSRTAARLFCVLGGLHLRSGVPGLRSLVPINTNPTLKLRHFLLPYRLLLPYTFFFRSKTKISGVRADFYCRLIFLVPH